jgi:hypothetical protein
LKGGGPLFDHAAHPLKVTPGFDGGSSPPTNERQAVAQSGEFDIKIVYFVLHRNRDFPSAWQ